MLERRNPRQAKIAFFAVAHKPYWAQFPDLYDHLMGYHAELKAKLEANGVTVQDFGMSDSSERGYELADQITAYHPDVVICNMVTYATSSVFAPIMRAIDCPIVLAALQPLAALDYTKANTFMQLENDNVCSVPEFTGVAIRLGKKVNDVIFGTLHNDADADAKLAEWCEIAKVLHDLKGARLGLMGHVMEAMYDMHADPTALSAAFGLHVPLLEIEDVVALYQQVTEPEIKEKSELILREFDTPDPGSDPLATKLNATDLHEAARTAVALDKLVEKYHLTGLAYYYAAQDNTIQRDVASSFIVGNSILNAEGIPMCGEYDIKTLVAMLIMDRLDIGGSFAELHPFDFNSNCILIGHDGPHHLRIAESRPVLRSLAKYHGKPGHGASVEFKLKEGPITMLGLTQNANGKFKFVIGEGYSQKGPIPPTGNTNTRAVFDRPLKEFIRDWVMQGPTHHYALGIGHHADTLAKIADALGVEYVIVR